MSDGEFPRRGVVVAGLSSGSGKTVATMALLRGLWLRGFDPAAFKCGPDFIDPRFHEAIVCGPSFNLDPYFLSAGAMRELYDRSVAGRSGGVIEGVMGLFDGESRQTSTADIARILNLPVILVIGSKGLAETISALVKGVMAHAPDLHLIGVIATLTGSDRHGEILRNALEQEGLPPLLGTVPRLNSLALPERKLGLVGALELARSGTMDALIPVLDRQVVPGWDWNRLSSYFRAPELPREDRPAQPALPFWAGETVREKSVTRPLRLGVAYDDAFCFYYPENMLLLKELGVCLVPFSPLSDKVLPPGLDGLFLGGGYPELYADVLSANVSMKDSIREYSRSGYPVLAECGGFLYLTRGPLEPEGGKAVASDFVGLFPYRFSMGEKLRRLGYVEVRHDGSGPFSDATGFVRGHLFHYSSLVRAEEEDGETQKAFIRNEGEEGLIRQQTAGSYVHLYLPSNPDYARSFVSAMAQRRPDRQPLDV